MYFSTGQHYLDVGIVIALFAGIFWWTYTLTSKSHARRKLDRIVKKAVRQPWDDDRDGGRGNR